MGAWGMEGWLSWLSGGAWAAQAMHSAMGVLPGTMICTRKVKGAELSLTQGRKRAMWGVGASRASRSTLASCSSGSSDSSCSGGPR